MEEPEIPGPLLGPYFQMLIADDAHVDDDRAIGLLDLALKTCRATGEQFCEAEILRVRARRRLHLDAPDEAAEDYAAAVDIARERGAAMLELKALTDWVGLPGAPDRVRTDLEVCADEVGAGGACRNLDRARRVLEDE
jgi:hypothetical protein